MVSKKKGTYGRYIPFLITLGDFTLVNIVFYLAVCLNPDLFRSLQLREIWLLTNIAMVPVSFWQFRHEGNRRAIVLEHAFTDSLYAVAIHAACFLPMMLFLHINLRVLFYLSFYGIFIVAMPVWWVLNRYILKEARRRGRNSIKVVIVGTSRTGLRLAREMRGDAGFGYRLMGFFDKEKPGNFSEHFLGTIDDLGPYVSENGVDEIFFALPGEEHELLSKVVKVADDNVASFYYVPQISRYLSRDFDIHNLGALPVLSIRRNPLKSSLNRIIKRTFDLAFSSVVLLFSPLVFIPVAIGIKMSSPGPVFFRQKRTGYLGKSFNCLKFRTMRVNANADRVQATKDDPRKTRFGDFLRRTSIDELPQFINVWRGDMSVVGPRPHMVKQTEDYTRIIDKYMVRHAVKPGITGWAQVNGYRGITDQLWKMERRVEYDVWYIEHWSFFLDLKIVVRTVINAVAGEKNAF